MKRDFIDLWNLDPDEGWLIIRRTGEVKRGENPRYVLESRSVALLFTKPSTRTRISFEVAVKALGGSSIFLMEDQLQLVRGEDVKDTARTLSRYVDCVIVRNHSHTWLEEFARWSSVKQVPPLSGAE